MTNSKLNISFLALAAILIGFGNSIYAQSSTSNDSLSGETVVIIRGYEPVIKDAKKINNQPVLNTVDNENQEFKYDVVPQNTNYKFTPDTISAVKIKGEPLNKLYHVYAKAGVGNYLNTLGELHVNSVRSRDFQWGLDVHHRGSNGGINDLPYNGFSKQNVDLHGKKMLRKHIVNAGFNFDNAVVYQYGFNPNLGYNSETIVKDQIQQKFMLFGGNVGLRSFITDSNLWNYQVDLSYYNLGVKPSGTSENNFLLKSQFTKYYGNEKGFLYFDVDFNRPTVDLVSTTYAQYPNNTLIKPGVDVEFTGDQWRLLAGFKMALETGESTNFYVYPNAEFKYNVVKNLIVPYVGVTGGIQRTSIHSLRLQNPFINGAPELKNTRTAYDTYLGVRGAYSANISYNISGGYKQIKDMALFVSNSSNVDSLSLPLENNYYENVYRPTYDTVNVAYISAQISYQKEEKWNLIWRLNYNNYEPLNEVKAWNLPDFTSDATLRYNLENKIIAKASLTFMSGRYSKTGRIEGAEKLSATVYGRKLKPIVDINLGAEYRFTNKISAFIDMNNILSQNYEVWGNYQVQGINVLGGITISFWEQ